VSERQGPSVLHSVADLLARPVATDELLAAMVDRVVLELDAERGTLYLLDARRDELVSRVAHLPELSEIRLPRGRGVAGHVAATGKAVVLPDARDDLRFFSGVDELTGFITRSMLAVPVSDPGGGLLGVLQVLNARRGAFSVADLSRARALAEQVAQALRRTSLRPDEQSREGVLLDGPFNLIVGRSAPMAQLYRRVLAVASTDATVLLRGETGTGKSLFARALHDSSPRKRGPFVRVDCSALPAGLIESELFGHERGAFTGADRRVEGKVEQAQGGTLLLDEIGELPPLLQSKLLGFLQDHKFARLGGRHGLSADVRIITATNAPLEALVAARGFRQDLYYRIRVVELAVPALRERGPQDVLHLAEHFLDLFRRRHRRKLRGFAPDAAARLQSHRWPGNVRELEHCVEAAVVLCDGDWIRDEHLSLPSAEGGRRGAAGYPPNTPLDEVVQDHIRRTVDACGGNQTEAARLLGIGRNTLRRRITETD